MDYTREEVERICRYAFKLAEQKGLPCTLGFKSNVLEYVSEQLWEPVFWEIAEEFPTVKGQYYHIDALNGPRIISQSPEGLGVVVTGNMFGDVFTDLTSTLFGGMGVGSSACINPNGVSMFEPIHGSSPKDYGKGIVSPIAAMLSGAMMLENIGEIRAARAVNNAVERVFESGRIPNLTINSGVSTQKQTAMVLEELLAV